MRTITGTVENGVHVPLQLHRVQQLKLQNPRRAAQAAPVCEHAALQGIWLRTSLVGMAPESTSHASLKLPPERSISYPESNRAGSETY
ncbi:hypothetical protein EYF80_051614 [Liparis tanakae]|uniref:Uncharacterized protein n=1 Tax=Liparis tanakae TaxID=230148 RepID=A0A4Z2FBA7_9TELE|nr:hypothetical protein EYF80_051614 [Liparis tanakae]